MSYRTLLATTGAAALLLGLAGPAAATLVHSGDSTIDGSLCVGFDCAGNENMGFTTLKIEENNLRIGAADSSSTASFPTRDWQIEFNSSSNGGGNYFKIRDCGNSGMASGASSTCGGTSMFTIEAGADNDSIYVESSGNQGGNVGLGTTNPGVDLDVLSGNTPTVRLQQDGSSGFAPQTWDLAGNETSFFIRDVTNGSTLPFRVFPTAPSTSLIIDADGDIGTGTGTAADASLEVRRTNGTASVLIDEASGTQAARGLLTMRNNGGSFITMANTNSGNDWFFTHENGAQGRFIVNRSDDPTEGMKLSANGDMTIGGTLTENSDKNAKMAIVPVDEREVLDKVASLPISSWTYKSNADQGTRHIGPMAQDFYALFGTGASETGLSTMDTSGVALAAIKALRAENDALRTRLQTETAALRTRLEALEAQLAAQ